MDMTTGIIALILGTFFIMGNLIDIGDDYRCRQSNVPYQQYTHVPPNTCYTYRAAILCFGGGLWGVGAVLIVMHLSPEYVQLISAFLVVSLMLNCLGVFLVNRYYARKNRVGGVCPICEAYGKIPCDPSKHC